MKSDVVNLILAYPDLLEVVGGRYFFRDKNIYQYELSVICVNYSTSIYYTAYVLPVIVNPNYKIELELGYSHQFWLDPTNNFDEIKRNGGILTVSEEMDLNDASCVRLFEMDICVRYQIYDTIEERIKTIYYDNDVITRRNTINDIII